jgi:hypothetical protein
MFYSTARANVVKLFTDVKVRVFASLCKSLQPGLMFVSKVGSGMVGLRPYLQTFD